MGVELRNPSQWRGSGTCCGLDTPSTLALLRTRLHPLTPGTPRSPKAMAPLHVVPFPLCDSRAALLAITSTPQLGAGVRLLPDCPAPALGSLHKCCSGVVRDNNRHESHRNKANTEACCFLFTRILDFNFLVQKLHGEEDACPVPHHEVFVPACPCQVSAAGGRSQGQEHHEWC